MSMTVQQLMAEARKLSPADQERLVAMLLAESAGGPDPAREEAWKAETRRRIADIESGREKGVPGEQVLEEVRKIVGR